MMISGGDISVSNRPLHSKKANLALEVRTQVQQVLVEDKLSQASLEYRDQFTNGADPRIPHVSDALLVPTKISAKKSQWKDSLKQRHSQQSLDETKRSVIEAYRNNASDPFAVRSELSRISSTAGTNSLREVMAKEVKDLETAMSRYREEENRLFRAYFEAQKRIIDETHKRNMDHPSLKT